VTQRQGDRFLDDREPVIVVERGAAARAYPLQILVWHEIVNDRLAGRPIAVTYCPLCNSGVVFDRRVDGRDLTFGTTGKLRRSDLVMWDRQTESWWQQFSGDALVGTLTGRRLRMLASQTLSWRDFKHIYPRGTVLSRTRDSSGTTAATRMRATMPTRTGNRSHLTGSPTGGCHRRSESS